MILVYVMEIVFHRIQNNNSYIIEKLEPTVLEEVKLHGEEQERSVILLTFL